MIAWGRCTPLTIVDLFGMEIRDFTGSTRALLEEEEEYDDENSRFMYQRFLVWRDEDTYAPPPPPHTHRTTTVTLAVYVRRGLMILCVCIMNIWLCIRWCTYIQKALLVSTLVWQSCACI